MVSFINYAENVRIGSEEFFDKETGDIRWSDLSTNNHLFVWILDPKKCPVIPDTLFGKEESFYLSQEGYDSVILDGEITAIEHSDDCHILSMAACEAGDWLTVKLFVRKGTPEFNGFKVAAGPTRELPSGPRSGIISALRALCS